MAIINLQNESQRRIASLLWFHQLILCGAPPPSLSHPHPIHVRIQASRSLEYSNFSVNWARSISYIGGDTALAKWHGTRQWHCGVDMTILPGAGPIPSQRLRSWPSIQPAEGHCKPPVPNHHQTCTFSRQIMMHRDDIPAWTVLDCAHYYRVECPTVINYWRAHRAGLNAFKWRLAYSPVKIRFLLHIAVNNLQKPTMTAYLR